MAVEYTTLGPSAETAPSDSSSYCKTFCKACAACCCCLLMVPLVILLGLLLVPWLTCQLPLGINGLPFGYLPAMLSIGSLISLPRRMTCLDNVWTNVYGWDEIWGQGKEYPAKQWSGEWWRGNELGYIINNPVFWSESGIWPQTNAIGLLPSQHKNMRPFFVDAYQVTSSKDVSDEVRKMTKEFFAQRREAGELKVQSDLLAFVHQILYKNTFDQEISWSKAQEFVAVQQKKVALGTVSQAFPGILYGTLSGTVSSVEEIVRSYMPLVEQRWGDQLTGLDCSPSPNCTLQLASSLYDALYSAGGLSLPQVISSGLGVLYSTRDSNPSPGFKIPQGQAAEFFWEATRFYPPVVGFPHWRTRPVCDGNNSRGTAKLNKPDGETEACKKERDGWFSGFPPVNQYRGGERVVLDLPSGQWDTEKWGPEADEFHLYSLDEYDENSVGYAEMAVDKEVADGDMNRDCPGRMLANIIGKVFFEEFNQDAWEAEDSNIKLVQAAGPNTVSDFVLKPMPEAS